jgi:hypothetical protein
MKSYHHRTKHRTHAIRFFNKIRLPYVRLHLLSPVTELSANSAEFLPYSTEFCSKDGNFWTRRRLQSPARAEGEVSHGASVLPTPGGGNSLHVRRGLSGPILSYLIYFKF